MTPTFEDTDDDGMKEPLWKPRDIDEAAEAAEELGLEGGVHPQKTEDGETMFAPGDSPGEFDRVQEQVVERNTNRDSTDELFDEEGDVRI